MKIWSIEGSDRGGKDSFLLYWKPELERLGWNIFDVDPFWEFVGPKPTDFKLLNPWINKGYLEYLKQVEQKSSLVCSRLILSEWVFSNFFNRQIADVSILSNLDFIHTIVWIPYNEYALRCESSNELPDYSEKEWLELEFLFKQQPWKHHKYIYTSELKPNIIPSI